MGRRCRWQPWSDQFYAEVQAMWTLGHFVADPTAAENEVTAVEAGSLEGSLEALRPTLLAIARMQLQRNLGRRRGI